MFKKFGYIVTLAGLVSSYGLQVKEPPSMGPYKTSEKVYQVPAMDQTDPRVWVLYPQTNNTEERFPLVSYMHGDLGGNVDLLGYTAQFQQIVSYGFVLVATFSCSTGCHDDTSLASSWTCQGVQPVQPLNQGWGTYYAEGIKMIDWAHNMTDSGVDKEIFGMIDWEKGVGVAGHSMGGQATALAAGGDCPVKWNIKAAVMHHPADGATVFGNIGSNITIPTIGFTSSGDGIWPYTEALMAATTTAKAGPIAYRYEVGWSHLEPVLTPGKWENPYLATFTAAWFKIFLNDDKAEYYDLVFGESADSLCNHAEMVDCWVKK